MIIPRTVVGFAAGVAVGFVLGRNWDGIREAARPVAERASRRARRWAALGREAAWDARERVEDWVAEQRWKAPPDAGDPA